MGRHDPAPARGPPGRTVLSAGERSDAAGRPERRSCRQQKENDRTWADPRQGRRSSWRALRRLQVPAGEPFLPGGERLTPRERPLPGAF